MLVVNNMKYLFCFVCFCIFSSCDKNNNEPELDAWWRNADIVELDASSYQISIADTSATGDFVKFSFSKGDIVTNENWDIAFRGTTLILNGGEKANIDQPARTGNAAGYITIGVMSEIFSVDTSILLQDNSSGSAILNNSMVDDLGISAQGWASYSFVTHLISPRPGRILVFRTHDNKYAKMEIIYFYDTLNPQPSDGDYGGFYTFNYQYQPDGSASF